MLEVTPEKDSAALAIFDVRALVANLQGKHGKLEKSARKWIATHSCSADLAIVRDYLSDAVRWHSTRRESLGRAKTALLHCAILSYFRLFDPSATRHRAELSIVGKFSAEQMVFHKRLLELRHEALAHFGQAGITKPWNEDALYVIADRTHWQPMVASKRSQFDASFGIEFYRHVEEIEPFVEELVEKWKADFQEKFQTCWATDQDFDQLLRSCKVEPTELGGWQGPILSGHRSGRLLVELPDGVFDELP